MQYIQNIVQTNNEKSVSYLMLALGALVFVLFVVYIVMMYQVTNTAYAITSQEKEASVYLDTVAVLENEYHAKRKTLNSTSIQEFGFAKIGQPTYVSVDTQTYTLAR